MTMVQHGMLLAYAERHRDMGPASEILIEALAHSGLGNSETRPKLLWTAYQAFGADSSPKSLSNYRVAMMGAALEIFQHAADIIEDMANRSPTRRGHNSLAAHLARRHAAEGWLGDSTHFSVALAQLVADIVMLSGVQTFRHAVEDALDPEQQKYLNWLHDDGLSAATLGYLLDVLGPRLPEMPTPEAIVDQAMYVANNKTGRFIVAAPLAMGAAAAGASRKACDAMIHCGTAAGEAFHLREDQLSTTGTPTLTGKPSGSGLQEGKRTVLIGLTLQRLPDDERRSFIRALQRGEAPLAEERVQHLQKVIANSGALEALEEIIQAKVQEAIEDIDATALRPEGKVMLREAIIALSSPDQSF